jgi:predicted nucleic acid-binding OB-fold protein
LSARAALDATGALPENVNYAVKSREGRHVAVPNFRDAGTASLPILESVPAVSAKLKEPITADRKFEDVVKSAQDAAVLVLVY